MSPNYPSATSLNAQKTNDHAVIFAGNPNVGKSTFFNAATGLKQHTGNWSGKTVGSASGYHEHNGVLYKLIDIPGCYSLKTNSAEESCAADVIKHEKADKIVVVCDACSLERNLNLLLQICELKDNVILALNFADTAIRKGIHTDTSKLKKLLKIPVITINARKKQGIDSVFEAVNISNNQRSFRVDYGKSIEHACKIIIKSINSDFSINKRYLALRLIENDEKIWNYIKSGVNNKADIQKILSARHKAMNYLHSVGISQDDVKDIIALALIRTAHKICKSAVVHTHKKSSSVFSLADRILTGKYTGFLVMLLVLSLVLYITIKGANYPSEFLTVQLFKLEKHLYDFLKLIRIPDNIANPVVYGGYRVLSWVVSVMLPPMAIFFPLFTILEDIGYLPRIAFNLDKCFKKCKTCGKQALTTCMGFGCNAAGVTGARIIDSPREKLIAILTNSFIPCNGKFPALITLITIFFMPVFSHSGVLASLYLTVFIVLSIAVSLLASKLLSSTVLKGIPSSFALELPPYRKPQIKQIIIRSVLDRCVFVLARSMVVAFPAGIILYLMCNINISGISLIKHISHFFNPLGRLMGMDGAVITAFLFGIPANEIVLPVALMIYSSGSVLSQVTNYSDIFSVLSANGWNITTALCTIIFFIMHWPCSTTLLTVKKETGSIRWAALAFLLPTVFGIISCIFVNLALSFFAI